MGRRPRPRLPPDNAAPLLPSSPPFRRLQATEAEPHYGSRCSPDGYYLLLWVQGAVLGSDSPCGSPPQGKDLEPVLSVKAWRQRKMCGTTAMVPWSLRPLWNETLELGCWGEGGDREALKLSIHQGPGACTRDHTLAYPAYSQHPNNV
jgi:hypothetical protein